MQGCGLTIPGFGLVYGFGFKVWDFGFRIQGTGFEVYRGRGEVARVRGFRAARPISVFGVQGRAIFAPKLSDLYCKSRMSTFE